MEVANYQHYQNYNIDDNTRNLIIVLEGLVMHGLGLCLLLGLGLEGLSMRNDELAGPGLRLLLGLGLHLLHLLAAGPPDQAEHAADEHAAEHHRGHGHHDDEGGAVQTQDALAAASAGLATSGCCAAIAGSGRRSGRSRCGLRCGGWRCGGLDCGTANEN